MIGASMAVRCGDGIWADLRVANDGSEAVRIHDPGDHRPTPGWEHSREAYQVAALRSFGFLDMALYREDGSPVAPAPIHTRADHLVSLPLALAPGAALVIPVPLHEFYALDAGTDYALALTYGDARLKVSATTQVHCP